MKIPEANASPRKVCKENEKKENNALSQKYSLRRRITKGGEEKTEAWISVNFGLLIPNRLKVLVV